MVNRLLQYLKDLYRLPTYVRMNMATLEEIQAQQAQTQSALSNIAGDVSGLKTKLDAAIADAQGQVDAAVAAALQQVSDGMQPIVDQAQQLADATPEDSEPSQPDPVTGDQPDPFA